MDFGGEDKSKVRKKYDEALILLIRIVWEHKQEKRSMIRTSSCYKWRSPRKSGFTPKTIESRILHYAIIQTSISSGVDLFFLGASKSLMNEQDERRSFLYDPQQAVFSHTVFIFRTCILHYCYQQYLIISFIFYLIIMKDIMSFF